MKFADNNFSHSAGSCKQFSIKRHAEKKQIKLLKDQLQQDWKSQVLRLLWYYILLIILASRWCKPIVKNEWQNNRPIVGADLGKKNYPYFLIKNLVEVKFMWQFSYPPANGASLGSYLSKNCCFWAKTGIIQPILFRQSWDNLGQNSQQTDRKTDRQTNSLTPYVCRFFLLFKFATTLFTSLARGLFGILSFIWHWNESKFTVCFVLIVNLIL